MPLKELHWLVIFQHLLVVLAGLKRHRIKAHIVTLSCSSGTPGEASKEPKISFLFDGTEILNIAFMHL